MVEQQDTTNPGGLPTDAGDLRVLSERFALVLEGTRLGLWDWNPQTNAVVFDARWAEMLGHTLDEIPFELASWESRVHPDDLEACHRDLRRHMAGELPFYENVHRMRHKDGHWVHILDRGKIVEYDAEGNPIRFTGTHTDISAQREAELEALAAAKAKTRFLAMMSHEIRTPLHGILGMLQLLQDSDLDGGQAECVKVVQESGESLLVVLDDILDFARIEEDKLALDPHPFDPSAVVAAAHGLFEKRAETKGLELTLDIADDVPPSCVSDSYRLRQIVSNLLSNAIKFTDQGKVTTKLTAVPSGGMQDEVELTLEVRDTGKGIIDVDAIWGSFEQEDSSVSRLYGGSGLGLAIVRRLVDMLGGTVRATSGVGKGSTFTVVLPMRVASADDDGSGAEDGDEAQLPSLRILVAEDHPVNQLIIRGMLQRWGQECTVVDNGVKAVHAVIVADYDVVLLDLHMPKLDGYEVCSFIRGQLTPERQPHIVALTADVFASTREECAAAGMDGFLGKPFRKDDLLRVIAESARACGLLA